MLLRVPKMYSDIFGFQRWAWWPKCTPASNSWRMLKSGSAIGSSPVDPPRTASPAIWSAGHRTAVKPRSACEFGGAYIDSAAPAQQCRLQRLDGNHAGNRLDGAGDLRRHLEAPGQFDLDLISVR